MPPVLSLEQPLAVSLRDYDAQVHRECGASQPCAPPLAGSDPAEPSGDSFGLGRGAESSRCSGTHALSESDPGDPGNAPVAFPSLSRATLAARRAALFLIRLYQTFLSPLFPPRCRYLPTCSAYAYEAIEKWGLLRGVYFASRRLLRCQPFGRSGYDPVP
jgi:uncharacterized protein